MSTDEKSVVAETRKLFDVKMREDANELEHLLKQLRAGELTEELGAELMLRMGSIGTTIDFLQPTAKVKVKEELNRRRARNIPAIMEVLERFTEEPIK